MAEILKADKSGYEKAAALLKAGELVVLPTDTVYGLAGLADNQAVLHKIYEIKKRPKQKAMSVVVFTPSHAKYLAHISPLAQKLMDKFWPGALTIVLPARTDVPTLAIRCPAIDWADEFLHLGFEGPLVLPSANISGQPAPISAKEISANIADKIPLILDGGICKAKQESTILTVDGDRLRLLRIGALAPDQFAEFDIEMDLP